MHIISQDKTISVPFENTAFQIAKIYTVDGKNLKEADLNAVLPSGMILTIGIYDTEDDAKRALEVIHLTNGSYMQVNRRQKGESYGNDKEFI